MTHYGLEKLVSLSNTELRSMAAELTLPHSVEIKKDDLIKSVSNVMIDNEEDAIDMILMLIEKEEEDDYVT